jgi:hypothetical protein
MLVFAGGVKAGTDLRDVDANVDAPPDSMNLR